jgi:hypothetical protein
MHIAHGGKERTLQEMTDVALSAGWQVTEVIRKPEGSLFCSIVAIPISIPPSTASLSTFIGQENTGRGVSPVVDTSNSPSQLPSPKGEGVTTSRGGSAIGRLTKRLREQISKTFSRASKSGGPGGGGEGKPATAKSAST